MLFPWIIFASLTVVGSLMYNVCVKLATASMNGFLFACLLAFAEFVSQIIVIGFARGVGKIDVFAGATPQNVGLAVLAGAAVALINVAYFFAMRTGSAVACQSVWTIGGLLAFTLVAFFFFHETLTLQKAFGIVLGIASLVLIIYQPK